MIKEQLIALDRRKQENASRLQRWEDLRAFCDSVTAGLMKMGVKDSYGFFLRVSQLKGSLYALSWPFIDCVQRALPRLPVQVRN